MADVTHDSGGQATPCTTPFPSDGTLQDWFAGQALVALMSRKDLEIVYQEESDGFLEINAYVHETGDATAARIAYDFAEAMIKEKKRREGA